MGGSSQKHMVGLCRKTQEETQTRPGRRQDPHLLSTCPQQECWAGSLSSKRGPSQFKEPHQTSFSLTNFEVKDDFQLFIYQPKKKLFGEEIIYNQTPHYVSKTTSINSAVTASDPLNCPIRCLPILQVRKGRSITCPGQSCPGHWDWAQKPAGGLGAAHLSASFPSSICTKGHIHAQVDVPLYNPCQEGCYWLSACVPNKIHVKALTPNVRVQ